jgi:trans-aconitate methyltransferase
VGYDQVLQWTESVLSNLAVGMDDCVADLCCGNGLITRLVADRCRAIVGVDFSAKLIDYAERQQSGDNVTYVLGNVAELGDDFFSGIGKVYMYEAVQHLSVGDFATLLTQIAHSPDVERFFVAGIPDSERLEVFYDTEEKRAFHRQCEAAGRPHIGNWWSRSDLVALVRSCGLKAEPMAQPEAMYCSHFRFDCLITR